MGCRGHFGPQAEIFRSRGTCLRSFRLRIVSPTSCSLTSEVFSLSCQVSSLTAFARLVAKRRRYCMYTRIALFCIMDERINFDCFVVDSSYLHLILLAFISCVSFAIAKRIEFLSLRQRCLSSEKSLQCSHEEQGEMAIFTG